MSHSKGFKAKPGLDILPIGQHGLGLLLRLDFPSHLVRRSLEDTGALVDRFSPQTDVFVLQLLWCAVHGLGNETTFWYLTLWETHHVLHRPAPEGDAHQLRCSDTHHALSSQEIRDDLLVYIVHQPSRTLVVIACIDEELLAGVFVDKWTHLCGCDEDTS